MQVRFSNVPLNNIQLKKNQTVSKNQVPTYSAPNLKRQDNVSFGNNFKKGIYAGLTAVLAVGASTATYFLTAKLSPPLTTENQRVTMVIPDVTPTSDKDEAVEKKVESTDAAIPTDTKAKANSPSSLEQDIGIKFDAEKEKTGESTIQFTKISPEMWASLVKPKILEYEGELSLKPIFDGYRDINIASLSLIFNTPEEIDATVKAVKSEGLSKNDKALLEKYGKKAQTDEAARNQILDNLELRLENEAQAQKLLLATVDTITVPRLSKETGISAKTLTESYEGAGMTILRSNVEFAGPNFVKGISDSDPNAARFKSWYEMRYRTNNELVSTDIRKALAPRRYLAAALNGAFKGSTPNKDEAKTILRLLAEVDPLSKSKETREEYARKYDALLMPASKTIVINDQKGKSVTSLQIASIARLKELCNETLKAK